MNIAVVGLGLIGGSVCKALKANTFHHIMGMDTDKETVRKALEQGAIDEEIDESRLGEANLTVVALYPVPTVEFVKKNADRFKKGSIVIDVGGVKGYVVNGCTPILDEKGVYFLGTHPMAGTENSGFDYSKADMFVKASYILTPTKSTPAAAIVTFTDISSLSPGITGRTNLKSLTFSRTYSLFSSEAAASGAITRLQSCAALSMSRTPGIIGVSGKCPMKYGSLTETHLIPFADSFGTSSVTRSIIWKGGRCLMRWLISRRFIIS